MLPPLRMFWDWQWRHWSSQWLWSWREPRKPALPPHLLLFGPSVHPSVHREAVPSPESIPILFFGQNKNKTNDKATYKKTATTQNTFVYLSHLWLSINKSSCLKNEKEKLWGWFNFFRHYRVFVQSFLEWCGQAHHFSSQNPKKSFVFLCTSQ